MELTIVNYGHLTKRRDRIRTSLNGNAYPIIAGTSANPRRAIQKENRDDEIASYISTQRSRLCCPVLHLQPAHAAEFFFVVGDQSEAGGEGVGRDPEVVVADDFSP